MEIVIAAPAILTVAPRGMEIEYVSSSRLSFLHSSMLTGIFAAETSCEECSDKSFSFKHVNTSDMDFFLYIQR